MDEKLKQYLLDKGLNETEIKEIEKILSMIEDAKALKKKEEKI
jgi:hypothetical protein